MRFFETVGSATIIAYDDGPVLTTDPWIAGDAFFGSLGLDYDIPPEQLAAIREAKYHWFSHGHPDHLNAEAIPMLTKGEFLLADHFGNRIYNDLKAAGHRVRVLPDGEWIQLSKAIRVYSVANKNQDSMILIDLNGRLIINLNDSADYGESFRIRRIAKQFKEVYLLQLQGWGGADMLNVFDPSGRKLVSVEEKRRPIAPRAQKSAIQMGANKVIPFSGFHRYQREECIWVNELMPELTEYYTDAIPNWPEILPAFARVNCETDEVTPLNPPRAPRIVKKAEEFGDDWSDALTTEDKTKIKEYFGARESLRDHYGFIEVSAGGSGVTVDLNRDKRDIGFRFEAPRTSLMTAIEESLFDDLLIGNFMRVTCFNVPGLYPYFTPYVGKYADNGGAKSKRELRQYFGHYYLRDPLAHTLKMFSDASEKVARKVLPEDSAIFRVAKNTYRSWLSRKVS